MVKGLAVFVLVALTVVSVSVVSAEPHQYYYTYQSTNLYTNMPMIILLDDLDNTEQYIFTLETVDRNGRSSGVLGSRIVGPGVTSASISFHNEYRDFESNTALRVVDNFGQVKSEHFVAVNPHSDWFVSGTTDEIEKVGIGSVYLNPLNSEGYHHSTTPNGVITVRDGYTLLHYRADDETTTDVIRIWEPVGMGVVAEYELAELIAYNHHCPEYPSACNATFGYGQELVSFVVLNTNGKRLPFTSINQELHAFVSGDNPITNSIPVGGYAYGRKTSADATVSDGESVWIVSSDRNANEWYLFTNRSSLAEGSNIRATGRLTTNAVYDVFPIVTVEDTNDGVLSGDFFPVFSTSNFLDYHIGATTGNVECVVMTVKMDMYHLDPEDFSFVLDECYIVVDNKTIRERFQDVFYSWTGGGPIAQGLFYVVLTIGMVSGLRSARVKQGMVYGFGFVSISILFTYLMTPDFFTSLVIGLVCLFVLFLSFVWDSQTS